MIEMVIIGNILWIPHYVVQLHLQRVEEKYYHLALAAIFM